MNLQGTFRTCGLLRSLTRAAAERLRLMCPPEESGVGGAAMDRADFSVNVEMFQDTPRFRRELEAWFRRSATSAVLLLRLPHGEI